MFANDLDHLVAGLRAVAVMEISAPRVPQKDVPIVRIWGESGRTYVARFYSYRRAAIGLARAAREAWATTVSQAISTAAAAARANGQTVRGIR